MYGLGRIAQCQPQMDLEEARRRMNDGVYPSKEVELIPIGNHSGLGPLGHVALEFAGK